MELISPKNFKREIAGKQVELFTLKNSNGLVCQITNYGGRLVSLWTPDKHGNWEDIVLGYNNLDDYLTQKEMYFGALIGRYANRIYGGKFSLHGTDYQLALNDGANHIHGGIVGFHNQVWQVMQRDENSIQLALHSEDGADGYPGNLDVQVTYTLTNDNELSIVWRAESDVLTPVNFTQHAYFNLKGTGNGNIEDHLVQINASHYTPITRSLVPTGEIAEVDNSPFDFRQPAKLIDRLLIQNDQLRQARGFDHNFVPDGTGFRSVALISEPSGGRTLEVLTNEPGMQLYTGNFLDGSIKGKRGVTYGYRSALCCETQHFPDSVHHPDFPSVWLNPGQVLESTTVYKFGVEK